MHSSQNSCGSVASPKIFHTSKDPPLFFIMMRLNMKVALLIVMILGFCIIFSIWSICGDGRTIREMHSNSNIYKTRDLTEEIDCDINNEYVIDCRKEGDVIYIPFTFLMKYFDVFGKLVTINGQQKFEWSHHSYSKVYNPKGNYDPRGVFMYFENYNVEGRDRVKCVSAIEGVPISTQWEIQGYYYATQIAQFGLSHYSKNLTEPKPRRKVIENAGREQAKWVVPLGGDLKRVFDDNLGCMILNFKTGEHYADGITLKMDHVLDFILSVNIMLTGNSSFSVVLQNRETKEQYNLHYITSDILITAQDNNIYHGIGLSQEWKKITRDLIIDLQKGLNYLVKDKSRHKIPKSKFKIIRITLLGYGAIDNLTLSSSEHMLQFYNAAEWFVKHQDEETGGWAIPVKRHLASGFTDLKPGWYSAMGQGHALSVLSRAYYHSGGDHRYLNAALAGLKPFNVTSQEGGVLAKFLDKYPWYEEYPTQPASYVLNGFIYSLLGLYDLMTIAPHHSQDANNLYKQGMVSLKGMLTLFDMGSVTAYDLRHSTLGIAPNLARWDYHATHINQLLLLSTIDNEPLFAETAKRWTGYMSGKRAAHN